MTKKQKKSGIVKYDYYVHSLSENSESAYEAIIPAFDNTIVFGDNLEELEEGIRFTIESEIAERKKMKKPIPKPNRDVKYSGKILLRIPSLLHEEIALKAKAARKSLNKYIEEKFYT